LGPAGHQSNASGQFSVYWRVLSVLGNVLSYSSTATQMGPPGDERRLGPGGHPMPSGNSPMLMQGQGPPGLRPMDSKPMPPRPMAPSGRMMPLPPQHPVCKRPRWGGQ
jgi:hypothetical protein